MFTSILALIWLHFIGDFILQSDAMATKKSTNSLWLGFHVLVYSLPLLLFGWQFALVNGAAHFITDFITSRLTSYLWKHEERHWFFTVIGLDQAIHMTTLLLTFQFYFLKDFIHMPLVKFLMK